MIDVTFAEKINFKCSKDCYLGSNNPSSLYIYEKFTLLTAILHPPPSKTVNKVVLLTFKSFETINLLLGLLTWHALPSR